MARMQNRHRVVLFFSLALALTNIRAQQAPASGHTQMPNAKLFGEMPH
jgi:hypothetical protein